MSSLITPRGAAILIDVVDSRGYPHRDDVQRRIETAASEVCSAVPLLEGLHPTVGDEFQGIAAQVSTALGAVTWLRLLLADEPAVRCGIGVGEIAEVASERPIQDGSGWWLARAALEGVEADSRRAATRHRRMAVGIDTTGTVAPGGTEGGDADAARAWVALAGSLDLCLAGLDARSQRIAAGLLAGRSQKEIARAEGVSEPSVSRRTTQHGLAALADTVLGLVGNPPAPPSVDPPAPGADVSAQDAPAQDVPAQDVPAEDVPAGGSAVGGRG